MMPALRALIDDRRGRIATLPVVALLAEGDLAAAADLRAAVGIVHADAEPPAGPPSLAVVTATAIAARLTPAHAAVFADEVLADLLAWPVGGAATEAGDATSLALAFDDLEAVLAAVGSDPRPNELVRGLNPAAGSHAIPDDPREIAAALRAGQISIQRFPYYRDRYGERGQWFTNSDSAWLITLGRLHPPAAENQLRWLARLLALRGMPTLLLDRHLRVLAEEIEPIAPGVAPALMDLADALAEDRRQGLADDRLTALAEAIGGRDGIILAAALADERAGMRGAWRSVRGWYADHDAAWLARVDALAEIDEQPPERPR